MKEFFDLLGWKDLIVILLALVLIRISIIIPFYAQWYLPPTVAWDDFLCFAFGICFLFAGNNIAVKFYDEKQKIVSQLQNSHNGSRATIGNIKQYPDIMRLRGLWIVLWFAGIVAVGYACFKIQDNYYYPVFAILTMMLGYAYASYFRGRFLAGNICLALLYSAVIWSQLPHDADILVPFTYKFPNATATTYNDLIPLFVLLSSSVFVLTLLRDITGDITNTQDDKQKGFSTIGVTLGIKKSKILLYALSLLFIALVGIFLYFYRTSLGSVQILITIAITVLPVGYYILTLQKAEKQTDYNYLYVFLGMIFISLLFVISFCKPLFINGNI